MININGKLAIILIDLGLWFMVFNATFNNISFISWQSILLVDETGVPRETTDLSQVNDKLSHIMLCLVHLTKYYLNTFMQFKIIYYCYLLNFCRFQAVLLLHVILVVLLGQKPLEVVESKVKRLCT
jgi:hypothetical protein